MTNKIANGSDRRAYRMRARARRQQEVHERLTKAAVELHGSVGPAKTTVSDIARLAGVRRATVYNHFPTDRDLFEACSTHWFTLNPPPDPTGWERVVDPALRTQVALETLYGYYARGREMLSNVLRDMALIPAVREVIEAKWQPLLAAMAEMLAEAWLTHAGRPQDVPPEVELRATLRVALDFWTWQSLAAEGLSNENAARVVAGWLAPAGGAPR